MKNDLYYQEAIKWYEYAIENGISSVPYIVKDDFSLFESLTEAFRFNRSHEYYPEEEDPLAFDSWDDRMYWAKTIYGIEILCRDDKNNDNDFYLTIIVKTQEGLSNLFRILSHAYANRKTKEEKPFAYRSFVKEHREGLFLSPEGDEYGDSIEQINLQTAEQCYTYEKDGDSVQFHYLYRKPMNCLGGEADPDKELRVLVEERLLETYPAGVPEDVRMWIDLELSANEKSGIAQGILLWKPLLDYLKKGQVEFEVSMPGCFMDDQLPKLLGYSSGNVESLAFESTAFESTHVEGRKYHRLVCKKEDRKRILAFIKQNYKQVFIKNQDEKCDRLYVFPENVDPCEFSPWYYEPGTNPERELPVMLIEPIVLNEAPELIELIMK